MTADAGTAAAPERRQQRRLLGLMMSMFFAFGFCTVLVDTLVPKFRAMFALSYTEVMLTQFCYFGAYFVVSTPAGWLVGRIGYLRSIALGALVMACGALAFTPAALFGTYPGFLAALFVLATGVTVVQVAVNPVTAVCGPPAAAPSRLTLAQAFNSVATMLGPLFGATVILSHVATAPAGAAPAALAAFRQAEAHVFVAPFGGIAIVLAGLAALCWRVRGWSPPVRAPGPGGYAQLLRQRRLMYGALGIFTYVGAEVSIGSALASYLMQGSVLGVSAASAGYLVGVYWGLAMVGRFAGSLLLRQVPAGLALLACALGAGTLAVLSGLSVGVVAAATLLCVGLCNSIMFPTIFSLAIEGLGEATPEASGLLCLAIVGGAVVPVLTGFVADHLGLSRALLVPVLCYVWIGLFGGAIWRGSLRPGEPGRLRKEGQGSALDPLGPRAPDPHS